MTSRIEWGNFFDLAVVTFGAVAALRDVWGRADGLSSSFKLATAFSGGPIDQNRAFDGPEAFTLSLIADTTSSSTMLTRLLRVSRVAKTMQLIRVMSVFHQLRSLVETWYASALGCFWALSGGYSLVFRAWGDLRSVCRSQVCRHSSGAW